MVQLSDQLSKGLFSTQSLVPRLEKEIEREKKERLVLRGGVRHDDYQSRSILITNPVQVLSAVRSLMHCLI